MIRGGRTVASVMAVLYNFVDLFLFIYLFVFIFKATLTAKSNKSY